MFQYSSSSNFNGGGRVINPVTWKTGEAKKRAKKGRGKMKDEI